MAPKFDPNEIKIGRSIREISRIELLMDSVVEGCK